MLHHLTIDDMPHSIWLSRSEEEYCLHHEGRAIPVSLTQGTAGRCSLCIGGVKHPLTMVSSGDTVFVHFKGNAYNIAFSDAVTFFAQAGGGSADDVITAPMPGAVVSVNVASGDSVNEGDVLAIIESMKLETALKAPRNGIIEAVSYEPGQTFERDAVLVKLVLEDD